MNGKLRLWQIWILVVSLIIAADGLLWIVTHDIGLILVITGMNLVVGLIGSSFDLRSPDE
jgi:hypothetical protein